MPQQRQIGCSTNCDDIASVRALEEFSGLQASSQEPQRSIPPGCRIKCWRPRATTNVAFTRRLLRAFTFLEAHVDAGFNA